MSNVDEMPAGRELDALVAEKVMSLQNVHRGTQDGCAGGPGHGYTQCVDEFYYYCPGYFSKKVPHYSADIAAAWRVVEKCALLDGNNALYRDVESNIWHVFKEFGEGDDIEMLGSGETAPLAICRAALKVVT